MVTIDSDVDCDMFLSYSIDKIESVRASITPSASFSGVFLILKRTFLASFTQLPCLNF